MTLEDPKFAQEAPKMIQKDPKIAQEAPNMTTRWLQHGPKTALRWPKMRQKPSESDSLGKIHIQICPNHPKTAPR